VQLTTLSEYPRKKIIDYLIELIRRP
jgi:hypothetical protein